MHDTRQYQTLDAKHQHHVQKMKRTMGELNRLQKSRAEITNSIQLLKASMVADSRNADQLTIDDVNGDHCTNNTRRQDLARLQKILNDMIERESVLQQTSIDKDRYFEDTGAILYNYYNGFRMGGEGILDSSANISGIDTNVSIHHRLDDINTKGGSSSSSQLIPLTPARPLSCDVGPGKPQRRSGRLPISNAPNIINIINSGSVKAAAAVDITNHKSSIPESKPNSTKNTDVYPKTDTPKFNTTSMARCRGSLLRDYCMLTEYDSRYAADIVQEDQRLRCDVCRGTNMHEIMGDCIYVCNTCYCVTKIVSDHDKPSYKEPPKEVSYYAYKRMNHFNEWLNQVQGKETTDIPPEVYDRILMEIRKLKITNIATIRHDTVKTILKKLKINKYYEHIPHILNRLNGRPMMQLPNELEERLRAMFRQIQAPFLKHSPLRKNFLSYSYVLHKFMQLLEEDSYLSAFPLLKSREKLHTQDTIWQKICNELDWQYIKST